MQSEPDLAPLRRVTRARFVVLVYLCALAFILYLDRICMGQAEKPIREEMELSKTQMSFIMMAFTLAYGLFEMPTGHWGDRIGARRVLARIVLWWSAFTALTGATAGFWSLLLVRFSFGAGEAGAFPNVARVVSRWFPVAERGRIQGILLAASLIGGTVAPVLAAGLIGSWGWRWTFVAFGTVGVVWVGAFLLWFRDDPAGHPAVSPGELRVITGGEAHPEAGLAPHGRFPWRATFTNRNVWLLGTATTCASFMTYLYFSWYTTYLREARGLELREAGWLTSLVLGGGAVGILLGGVLTDWVTRRGGSPTWSRRGSGLSAYLIAAVLLLAGSHSDDANLSAGLTALSCLALLSQQSNWWSSAIEVSGRHIGALFGLMNGMGTFGAMASQFFLGRFADWRQSEGYVGRAQWDPAFYVYAAVLVVGAFCWLFVDPTRRVTETRPITAGE
jgi:MFS transporter, ACS family, glucarate transporter